MANGQVWKTENAYIQIVELGKRLIDYRMMRQLGQSRRTQTSSIETMENYLKTNEARLVKGKEDSDPSSVIFDAVVGVGLRSGLICVRAFPRLREERGRLNQPAAGRCPEFCVNAVPG